MSIEKKLKELKQSIPENVTLVAVSKTKSVPEIMEAYNTGHLDFGENKVQDMVDKYEEMPKDIQWHMIGHVQRNKVKYMAEFVHLIHGVDSLKLLKEIDKQAQKHNRIIECLLQIKIAEEDSKFGLSFSEAKEILKSEDFSNLIHIKITGVMGMATFTENEIQIKNEFSRLKNYSDELAIIDCKQCDFTIISMGMSGDFNIAIAQGSNMIRVGSRIFGSRNY